MYYKMFKVLQKNGAVWWSVEYGQLPKPHRHSQEPISTRKHTANGFFSLFFTTAFIAVSTVNVGARCNYASPNHYRYTRTATQNM